MNWFRYLVLAIVILALLGLLIMMVVQFSGGEDPEDGWNRKDDNHNFDTGSLYNRASMPTLEEVLVHTKFIEQVKDNGLTFIYGYSRDNDYLASISYVAEIVPGYQIKIIHLATDELEFALFIPDTPDIIYSKETELAAEMLKEGYQIERQAVKLEWDDTLFTYQIASYDWEFVEFAVGEEIQLRIQNLTTAEKWIIRLDDVTNFLVLSEVFTSSERPELLNFLFYFENRESGERFNRKISLDLTQLSVSNSEDGKYDSADHWLYGSFGFIYDQWLENNKRGFLAIVASDGENMVRDDGYYYDVAQWVYLDATGRMQWYGNSVGIFNANVEPLDLAENSYRYELNLIEDQDSRLQQLVLEIYDNALNRQVKTREFIWERSASMIVPIAINTSNEN